MKFVVPPSAVGSVAIAVAIDAEFIKSGGVITARSVAFVPFIVAAPAPPKLTGSVARAGGKHNARGSSEVPPVTIDLGTTVVNLRSPAVLANCDVLPCGHALEPIADEWASVFVPDPLTTTGEDPLDTEGTASPPSLACVGAEDRVRRIDPYTIPNLTKWAAVLSESGPLPPGGIGAATRAALQAAFGPYGAGLSRRSRRGKGTFCSFVDDNNVAARDLASIDAFLRQCTATASGCMDVVARRCSSPTAQVPPALLRPVLSPSASQLPMTAVENRYVEAENIASFAKELSRAWRRYIHINDGLLSADPLRRALLHRSPSHRTPVYGYGNMDEVVVRGSIAVAEQRSPAAAGAPPSLPSAAVPVSAPRDANDLLRNRHEVVVLDATELAMFRHCGLREKTKLPRLVECVERLARASSGPAVEKGLAARQFLQGSTMDNHNPLWDATALACVVASLVKTPQAVTGTEFGRSSQ